MRVVLLVRKVSTGQDWVKVGAAMTEYKLFAAAMSILAGFMVTLVFLILWILLWTAIK